MEFLLVLVLIAIAAGAGYMIFKANRNGAGAASSGPAGGGHRGRYSPDELRIENVGPGGVYGLRGFGAEMKDIDVQVIARHTYEEQGWEWFELEGESELGKVWLTVEEDDETELSVSLRRFGFAELGVTKEQLTEFDEMERGGFAFEGTEYLYDDSGDAVFHRDGDRAKAERFYYWEFESRDGTGLISVERWADGSVEVHLSQPLKSSQITVYANTGAT